MTITCALSDDAELLVKPPVHEHAQWSATLTPITACGVTLPGHVSVACRVQGGHARALPFTEWGSGPQARTLLAGALREGADVLVFTGGYLDGTFTVRRVELHVQPARVAASARHARARSAPFIARLLTLLRLTVAQLLPAAGTPVRLAGGHTLSVQHLGREGASAPVIGRPGEAGLGGLDHRLAGRFARALLAGEGFCGRDPDSDLDAQAGVVFAPQLGLLTLEAWGESVTFPCGREDREPLARALLGACVSPVRAPQPEAAGRFTCPQVTLGA